MRRSALLTIAMLGGLVCLLGGTVLFSALQDTARTGTNSVESAALGASAESADIQLASATKAPGAGPIECGTFSENLSSALITVSAVSPGDPAAGAYFCIKNVGSQTVSLSGLAEELTDVDFACTGDEASSGDATCGGDQAGELSSVLQVAYQNQDCAGSGGFGPAPMLRDNATTPTSIPGALAAGATGCFRTHIHYPSTTDATAVQTAQSDRATWRFKFTAQA
jgi:hypothetical protein